MAKPTAVRIESIPELQALIAQASEPKVPNMPKGGEQFLVIPQGYNVVGVEKFMPTPRRITANMVFAEVASFLEYVDRFQNNDTLLTISPYKRLGSPPFEVVAHLEYPNQLQTSWDTHLARLQFAISIELAAWLAVLDKPLRQEQFADFIEDRSLDFADGDASALLTLINELRVNQSSTWESGGVAGNGARVLKYSKTEKATAGTGDVEIPPRVALSIPLFALAKKTDLEIRIRCKVEDGQPVFRLRSPDLDMVMQRTHRETRDEVGKNLKLTVLASA